VFYGRKHQLSDRARSRFARRSGKSKKSLWGQRQVIGIGRAVYWGAKLVVLDEPTAALGVRDFKKANELIVKLKQKNIAVVVISHNLEHVFSVADRVVVLRHGRIVGDRMIKETTGDEIVKMIAGAEFGQRGKTQEGV